MSVSLRYPVLFHVGWPLLLAGICANQVWDRGVPAAEAAGIRYERSGSGHDTLVVEDVRDGLSGPTFTDLAGWNGEGDAPQAIARWHQRRATMTGFAFPLQAGSTMRVFCLMRSTQTCCFGARPQLAEYILVEAREPVAVARLLPVLVTGAFHVEVRPSAGYLYRMADAEVAPMAWSASAVPWDWNWLRPVGDGTELPADLIALDGATVLIAGDLDQKPSAGRRYLVRSGLSGSPPSSHDLVAIESATDLPPGAVVLTGTLTIQRDATRWGDEGMATLRQARPAHALGLRRGPWLDWSAQTALVALFLLVTVRWRDRP